MRRAATFIRKALRGYEVKRDENKARFHDWQQARDAAAAIKYEGVNHLDHVPARSLSASSPRAAARSSGPATAQQARDYILKLAPRARACNRSSNRRR